MILIFSEANNSESDRGPIYRLVARRLLSNTNHGMRHTQLLLYALVETSASSILETFHLYPTYSGWSSILITIATSTALYQQQTYHSSSNTFKELDTTSSSMSSHMSIIRNLSDKEACPQKTSKPSPAQKTLFEDPMKISKPHRRRKKHHLKFLGPTQNDPITISSKTISPILRLPGEIRKLIYSYALTSPTSTLAYDASEMRFQADDIGLGLLSSCHAVALETQHLHFKLNTLVFALENSDDAGALKKRDMTAIFRGLGSLACARGWRFQMEISVRNEDTSQVTMLVRSRESL